MCKDLSKIQYLEIFNIIKSNNCPFSENKNGIFINLNNIDIEIIDNIFFFLNYIKHKDKDLIYQEEMINNAKKNINNIKDEIVNKNYTSSFIKYSDENTYNNNLSLSSDDDEFTNNKLSLKKKKIKYTGNKAKMMKSIKDNKLNQ